MEEVIWVEILSRQKGVTARHRCLGRAVRIGRGYSNDVVLDDPHVAAEHLLILRDADGRLMAEDLGSASGIVTGRNTPAVRRLMLDGDQSFRIGQTQLRIRDHRHAIAPERVAEPRSRFWILLLLLAAALIGARVLMTWLVDIEEFRASRYVMPPVYLVLGMTGWVGLWSVLARFITGETRFIRTCFIALVGALCFEALNLFIQIGAFALSWRVLSESLYMLPWLALAVVCFFHLRELNPTALKLKAAAVAALAVTVIAIQALSQSEARFGNGEQNYLHALYPPALRLAPLKNEEKFFGAVETMMKKLEAARKDAP